MYINLDKPQICPCEYCGLPFVSLTNSFESGTSEVIQLDDANQVHRQMNITVQRSRHSQKPHTRSWLKDMKQLLASHKESQTRHLVKDRMFEGIVVSLNNVYTRAEINNGFKERSSSSAGERVFDSWAKNSKPPTMQYHASA